MAIYLKDELDDFLKNLERGLWIGGTFGFSLSLLSLSRQFQFWYFLKTLSEERVVVFDAAIVGALAGAFLGGTFSISQVAVRLGLQTGLNTYSFFKSKYSVQVNNLNTFDENIPRQLNSRGEL
jgi:hypothetical protein